MKIKVNYYSLSPARFIAGTSGSYGFEELEFTFGPEWDRLNKKIVFSTPSGRSVSLIYEGVPVYIPAEVMAERGVSRFAVVGYLEEKTLISVSGEIDVLNTISPDADEAHSPTPGETAQVLAIMQETKAMSEQIAEDAERLLGDFPLVKGEGRNSVRNMTGSASGDDSNSEGFNTSAEGTGSHSEGEGTLAKNAYQHVFGSYNEPDPSGNAANRKGKYIEIAGNGASETKRSNARTLDYEGNEVLAGRLTLGADPKGNMDAVPKHSFERLKSSVEGIEERISNLPYIEAELENLAYVAKGSLYRLAEHTGITDRSSLSFVHSSPYIMLGELTMGKNYVDERSDPIESAIPSKIYGEGFSIDIPDLSDLELPDLGCGFNDGDIYGNTLDFKRGKYIRRCRIFTLTGNESWFDCGEYYTADEFYGGNLGFNAGSGEYRSSSNFGYNGKAWDAVCPEFDGAYYLAVNTNGTRLEDFVDELRSLNDRGMPAQVIVMLEGFVFDELDISLPMPVSSVGKIGEKDKVCSEGSLAGVTLLEYEKI